MLRKVGFPNLLRAFLMLLLLGGALPGSRTGAAPAAPAGACGDPATAIHTLQGAGAVSPEDGNVHEVEAVVVGDFQNTTNQLGGFFLQEEDTDADADPLTSEGIFVYDHGFGVDVSVGELVRVQGVVDEFFSLTELNTITNVEICGTGSATPSSLTLPVVAVGGWEAFEGMAVTFPQTLYVTENYNLGRYGEVELSVDGRLFQPTHLALPGAPALEQQALNDRSRIQLDDGSNLQNPLPLPPYLLPDNTLRVDDRVNGLAGVLSYAFGEYEIHPTGPLTFTRANERPAEPPAAAGSQVKVASFNVLNFFTTIDTGALVCGPSGGLECRGADTLAEFTRQRDKLVSALTALDADVVGLMEIENNASASTADLVEGLNNILGPGTYAFIDTGTIGTDAIKVALIYKPARVTPLGSFAILDSSIDPAFLDTRNRPTLAQTFEAGGERFTVAVNHLKSKGSSCDDIGDPDTGDGQGNCNLTRTTAAQALAGWLAADPTSSGDPDFLIIGDLNAYAMEDPVTTLKNTGYTNLVETQIGAQAYSYVFEGQSGYLDHALASGELARQVVQVDEWHINADEPSALDYNNYNQPLLYQPDAFRASDHDPVVVYLQPGALNLFLPFLRK